MIFGNWLVQQGKNALGKVKAGFVISVPWNVFEGTKNIEKPYLNMMLCKHLANSLRRNVERHFSDDREGLNVDFEEAIQVHKRTKFFKISKKNLLNNLKLLNLPNNSKRIHSK